MSVSVPDKRSLTLPDYKSKIKARFKKPHKPSLVEAMYLFLTIFMMANAVIQFIQGDYRTSASDTILAGMFWKIYLYARARLLVSAGALSLMSLSDSDLPRPGLGNGPARWCHTSMLRMEMKEIMDPEQSQQERNSWFEVQVVLKIQAADESDAIDRAAGAIRCGYQAVKGVHPVGGFDARPCASPLMRSRRI